MEIVAQKVMPESSSPVIPGYLQTTYWWAYIHPWGVRVFEHQWLVNLILWGNYRRLSNALLQDYKRDPKSDHQVRTLQIACAYGNLTPRLAQSIGEHGALDVIDILPRTPSACRFQRLRASGHTSARSVT